MIQLLLIIIINLMTWAVLAANTYECTGTQGQPVVSISTEKGLGNFEYFSRDGNEFSVNLPDDAIYKDWNTGGRVYINFRPGWSESTVNIYGWISNEGQALFDIYAMGLVVPDEVVETLTGYYCSTPLTLDDLTGTYKFELSKSNAFSWPK